MSPLSPTHRIAISGEMADLFQTYDWSATALGPMAKWSEALLAVVGVMLAAPFPCAIYWGPELALLYNDAYRLVLGEKHPRSLGQPSREVWAEIWELIYPELERCRTTGESVQHQDMLLQIRLDGRLRDLYWDYTFSPIYEHGSIIGIFNAAEDVTEKAVAARQLRQVLEATGEGVLSVDRSWRLTYMNPRATEILTPSGAVYGGIIWELYPHLVYEGSPYVEHYHRAMNEGIAAEFEAFYPEPLHIWVNISVRPASAGIIIFFRDVTEQKHINDELRASEERYRVFAELSPQALWVANANGLVIYANQRFLDYIGHDCLPEIGMEYLHCFHPEERERVNTVWMHSIQTGEDYEIDARLLRASDGAARWWHLRALPVRGANGVIEQWLGTATDVHDSHLAVQQKQEQYAEIDRQRRELEAVYRGSPVGMALYDPRDLRILRLNDRQAEILGVSREHALGRRVEEFARGVNPVLALMHRAAQGETVLNQPVEGTIPSRPGEYRYFNANYSPIFADDGSVQAIAGATIETTHQKRAEAALLQSEKLAAVGRLAASIAHEINNPLESVTNLLYLARNSESVVEIQQYLDLAERELRRVSVISNQTLRFHRQSTGAKAITCEELFGSVLQIYQGRLINCRIVVEKRKRANRPVVCFEGEIRQVFLNLVGNAIDSMAAGGRLLVRSREATQPSTGEPGLVFTFADTGAGMDRSTLSRLFEPFFTTKGIGGTGLGLWISQEIVNRHRGALRVRSSQRAGCSGTVFTLFLPFGGSSALSTGLHRNPNL